MILEAPSDMGPGGYGWVVCHVEMGIAIGECAAWFCPELGRNVCGTSYWHLRRDAEYAAKLRNGVAEKRFIPFAMKGRLC